MTVKQTITFQHPDGVDDVDIRTMAPSSLLTFLDDSRVNGSLNIDEWTFTETSLRIVRSWTDSGWAQYQAIDGLDDITQSYIDAGYTVTNTNDA
jgi:hypothetical protein